MLIPLPNSPEEQDLAKILQHHLLSNERQTRDMVQYGEQSWLLYYFGSGIRYI